MKVRPITVLALAASLAAPALHADLQQQAATFFDEGSLLLNLRARYEHADSDPAPLDSLLASDAVTFRTRLGFQSALVSGFQALIEAENVLLLSADSNVNLAGSNLPDGQGHTVIPDPETTQLNRLWASFSRQSNTLKLGRARVILDNARFIGNVGWRQNEQTYDMVSIDLRSVEKLHAFYSYVWHVNRVFGGEDGAPPDFDSSTHLFNASYHAKAWLQATIFAYLIDLEDDRTGAPFSGSGDTFGIRLAGATDPDQAPWNLSYALSYASQHDNSGSPAATQFDLDYYALELSSHHEKAWLTVGYEVLGGDGTRNFATPLATVHAFNGWADAFLAQSIAGTGATGVEDLYVGAGTTVPIGRGLSLKAYHHWFEANETSGKDGDLGSELNLLASMPVFENATLLAKYAQYQSGSSSSSPSDTTKFWLELSFSY